ncbi:cupin domain-containing protein [bacterium]|nr:cupin domain-containing protein [bacterium]
MNVCTTRPWGTFEVLLDAPVCKVKRITVRPGKRLSLQSHAHRAEHWVCVSGEGAAHVGDDVLVLSAGTSAFVPRGARHRMDNSDGQTDLVVIEVQVGTYFGEDDIVRYEDDFGRS